MQSGYQLRSREDFEAVTGAKSPAGKRYFKHTALADIIGAYPLRDGLSDAEVRECPPECSLERLASSTEGALPSRLLLSIWHCAASAAESPAGKCYSEHTALADVKHASPLRDDLSDAEAQTCHDSVSKWLWGKHSRLQAQQQQG